MGIDAIHRLIRIFIVYFKPYRADRRLFLVKDNTFSFRADIQVIRALAVTLVIAYHLSIPGFQNGFFGVDVFFVVSGFLMHKLYDPAAGAVAFWKKRAARLLPAYFVTVIAALVAGLFFLKPDGLDRLTQQAMFASGFLSNFGFWQEESYFTGIYFSPLLHLWSLGVEIQYYLIVPLVAAIFRRSRLGFACLLVGSFIACLVVLVVSPKTSFFMMPLRFWEFGLGMLVASWRGERPTVPKWLFPVAAVALIAMQSLLPLNGTRQDIVWGHPSIAALTACLLTCTMLASQLDASVILGSQVGRAVKGVGDISYSLYLVHFPIFAIYSYVPFEGTRLAPETAWSAFLLLALTAAAAVSLHRFVERPATKLVHWPRVGAAVLTTGAVAIALAPIQLAALDSYDRNLFSAGRDRAEYRCGKWMRLFQPTETFCKFGEDSDHLVLLVGDSHSDAIKQSFVASAQRHRLGVGMPVENEALSEFGATWLVGEAARLGADTVFLHHSQKGGSAERDGQIIDILTDAGLGVGFILPMPIADASVPRMLYEAREDGEQLPTLDRATYNAALVPYRSMLAARPQVVVVDPFDVACADTCPLISPDGHPYYFDYNHLTLTGAKRFEPLFDSILSSLRARWS